MGQVSGFDCLVWALGAEAEEEFQDCGKDANVGEREAGELEAEVVLVVGLVWAGDCNGSGCGVRRLSDQ